MTQKILTLKYPACKGTNCGCTDGFSHSPECRAEYDALFNEAEALYHQKHSGKFCEDKCPKCGASLLVNDYGKKWCSFIGGESQKACDYGITLQLKPDK